MDHDQIEELLELTRENNRILRGLHRAQMWSTAIRIIYWVIIIGGLLGSYYYFQPILEKYIGTYQSMMASADEMTTAGKTGFADLKFFMGGE